MENTINIALFGGIIGWTVTDVFRFIRYNVFGSDPWWQDHCWHGTLPFILSVIGVVNSYANLMH